MRTPVLTYRWFCVLLLALSAAGNTFAQKPGEAAVRAALSGGEHPYAALLWDSSRWREPLLRVYEGRNFAPLWFAHRQLNPQGKALLEQLRAAEARGLRSDDYEGNRLAAFSLDLGGQSTADSQDIAFVDVAFSIAAARFVTDLHAGRVDPRAAGHDLTVPHVRLDVDAALLRLASAGNVNAVLDDFEPPFRHYDLLKQALARYRLLASQPGLTALPPFGKTSIKAGDPYAGAPALRRLLRALGDLHGTQEPAREQLGVLDAALAEALINFQSRHGLAPDGVLGTGTYRELTTPLISRVRQIELSMERARWLPAKLDTPPILVNIPQFRLFAFQTNEDDEKAMLQMSVIVGQAFPTTRTPVFAADMRYVVLNPYWDVPYSILSKEFMPLIRKDPAWIARNGYEIVRGQSDHSAVVAATPANIEALARGTARLRQLPGPRNALGFVKFMFPNRHNVYLHGTPAVNLFSQVRRAFSHGCVRVSDPMALLSHVLREDPQWTAERINAALAKPGMTRITLRKPIRVYLFYATSLATEKGETLFFDDIYQHDKRLDALLKSRRTAPRS